MLEEEKGEIKESIKLEVGKALGIIGKTKEGQMLRQYRVDVMYRLTFLYDWNMFSEKQSYID